MSTHTIHGKSQEVYFCTFTCYKWLSLFEEANAYEAVYNWFRHLKKSRCFVVGYVIMPNHLHILLFPTDPLVTLNKLVGEGKRFIAYSIIKSLKAMGKTTVLAALASGVSEKEHLKGKKHQVFILSFDARECFSEKMLLQKLNYIHHNPVKGRWNLVEDFVDYAYSSASYYETGEPRCAEIIHYKDLNPDLISPQSHPSEDSEMDIGDVRL